MNKEQLEALQRRVKLIKKAGKGLRNPIRKKTRVGIRQEPGWHYHLVNDVGDSIAASIDDGYEFVTDGEIRGGEKDAADCAQMGKVACQKVGNGDEGFYMRMPQKDWEAYQREKLKDSVNFEKAIGLDKIPKHVRRGKIEITQTLE